MASDIRFRHASDLILVALVVLSLPIAGWADETPVFDGEDLSGWRPSTGQWFVVGSVRLKEGDPRSFSWAEGQGIMVNGKSGKTSDILSRVEHGDAKLHVEFCVPQGSNSGVYLMGRYEVQVFDSWGVEKPKYSDCGGIYQRWKDNQGYEGHAPCENASRRPGVWQSFDITFRAPRFDDQGNKTENARFVKVVHNGKVVHENVEVTGPTRAATFEQVKETSRGPLMLQGDHGPVAYRNIKLKAVDFD